jgi:hypothetical protein
MFKADVEGRAIVGEEVKGYAGERRRWVFST